MEQREWNKVFERYILEGKIHSEEYERLDEFQNYTIQEFKKLFKRLKAKNEANNRTN